MMFYTEGERVFVLRGRHFELFIFLIKNSRPVGVKVITVTGAYLHCFKMLGGPEGMACGC